MEPTLITNEDVDAARKTLLKVIEDEGYSESYQPVDEDWYRVVVNNKFLDLCISFDYNEGTVQHFVAYFYGLNIGLNILEELDYTTNFNNHEKFVFLVDHSSLLPTPEGI